MKNEIGDAQLKITFIFSIKYKDTATVILS